MAGHFVLWKMQVADRDACVAAGAGWTGLAHAAGVGNGAGGVFPGWTQASRDDLNRVRSAHGVPNRNNIPPHRYLTFPGGAPAALLAAQLLADRDRWISSLERPSSVGFGMVALCAAAQAAWTGGQSAYRYDALIAQITHGATSVEIYYLGSKEMT